jgi:hypothetical protein
LEAHRAALIGAWAGDERGRLAARAWSGVERHLDREWRDPRVSSETKARLLADAAARARRQLDLAFEGGLRARIGQRLAPSALDVLSRDAVSVLPPDAMISVQAFSLVRDLRRFAALVSRDDIVQLAEGADPSLSTLPTRQAPAHCVESDAVDRLLSLDVDELPEGVAVCEECTLIFEPARKRRGVHYCDRCGKKSQHQPRASFRARQPARGEAIAVRAPELDGAGRLRRWRQLYVVSCVECGGLFTAKRSGAVFCGPACDQATRRRVA